MTVLSLSSEPPSSPSSSSSSSLCPQHVSPPPAASLTVSTSSKLLSVIGYMISAIALIYFNKAAFSYYSFSSPNLLTLLQMISTLVFLKVFKLCGWAEYQPFDKRTLRRLLPLGLSFIGYMVFGMLSMKSVSIPIYTTLRRTTIVFVMAFEWLISHKSSPDEVKASVVVMLLGAFIAGGQDLNFDLMSYLLVVMFNICTAAYLVIVNQLSTEEKSASPQTALGKYDFLYYNSLIGIPVLACILATTNEVQDFIRSPYIGYAGFQLAILASSLLAFILNYFIFWNTAINSALTQTVSGQAKDVIVILVGFFAFVDAPIDFWNIVGITIGFAGSLLYAYAKLNSMSTLNEDTTTNRDPPEESATHNVGLRMNPCDPIEREQLMIKIEMMSGKIR